MKRVLTILGVVFLCAWAGGCASIRVCKAGNKVMVDVENNGWFLFDFIPLASGNTENPGGVCHLFSDSVTLDNNIDLIDMAVQKEKAVGVRDLVSYATDEYVFFILFKRHSMHTSAELVMPEAADETLDLQTIDTKKIRSPEAVEVNTGEDVESVMRPPAPPPRRGAPPTLKLLEF